MGKISSAAVSRPRIPPAADGIQVNFCKNPVCRNFGVPASATKRHDRYTLAASGRHVPVLKCGSCGEFPPVKSNGAIAEELSRVSGYLALPSGPSCPNGKCVNHGSSVVDNPNRYQCFGRTRSGSKRFRCKDCGGTFSVGTSSTLRQREPHKNRLVLQLLVNKTPLRRVCEIADISPGSLYPKIYFLHRQALAFVGARERGLEEMTLKRLYVGVDRQDYMVNWSRREDKRNVQLTAVGSADNPTGYVFGIHLAFDPALDPGRIEREAKKLGDEDVPHPFRRHARLWLDADYRDAIEISKKRLAATSDGTLKGRVTARYQEALGREDVEDSEVQTEATRLPARGCQIHAEYTLYGHFFLLKRLFRSTEKVRFFLDQDSGMRAACLGAFAERIKARTADAFYVRINKDLTVDEKKRALNASRAEFRRMRAKHPGLGEQALRLHLIKKQIAAMTEHGRWKDKWLVHPFPDMSEPEKAVCYLTDMGDYDPDHLAWAYNKASLHAIDRFFMLVRRRLSLLERPIQTASSQGRTWFGYSPYNPGNVEVLLDIFRVFYNYCLVGGDKKTPAMRLGIAKGRNTLEDVIYFQGK